MKVAALFVHLYLEEGPDECCQLEDLRWAWKRFMLETGIQEPESWLRDLVLDHGVVLEEPPRGKTWRGWRVKGVGFNAETAFRYSSFRLERMGLCR